MTEVPKGNKVEEYLETGYAAEKAPPRAGQINGEAPLWGRVE